MFVVTIEYMNGPEVKTTVRTWADVLALLNNLTWYRVAIVQRERI